MDEPLSIRRLHKDDAALIAAEFAKIGWHKPRMLYETYYEAQQTGACHVFVALIDEQFDGMNWGRRFRP